MNVFKRIWYIITGKHARYTKLEQEVWEHDGYPNGYSPVSPTTRQLSRQIEVGEWHTLYYAKDFLGDTKYQSLSEQEVQAWIDAQWNKEIYTIDTIEIMRRK